LVRRDCLRDLITEAAREAARKMAAVVVGDEVEVEAVVDEDGDDKMCLIDRAPRKLLR
jgi:hypothetical protein